MFRIDAFKPGRTRLGSHRTALAAVFLPALLLGFAAAASAQTAGQPSPNTAGRVEFAIGNVMVKSANGNEHVLTRGDNLMSGDSVSTNNGRAQIRTTDGAFVSLQPNTQFGVQQYSYDGKSDGSERGFYSLVTGAMRMVTGLVGRVNKSNFRITTPTATVGIRGTGGIISVLNDVTRVFGTSGTWTLSNLGGSVDVTPGQIGVAGLNTNTPPQQQSTGTQPATPPAAPPAPVISDAENKGSNGESLLLGGIAGQSLFYTIAAGSQTLAGFLPTIQIPPDQQGPSISINGSSTLDGSGNLSSFTWTAQSDGESEAVKFTLSGTHVDRYQDQFISLGRLIGTLTVIESENGDSSSESFSFNSNQGFHWMAGTPTAVMPTTGAFTYSLMGATSPTFASGSMAPGTVTSATGTVDFGGQTISAGWTTVFGTQTFNSSVSGSLFSNNATMSGSTSGGALCANSCATNAYGGFFGPNAERLGIAYQVNGTGDSFGGVMALGNRTPYAP